MSSANSASVLTVEYHLEQIFREAMPDGEDIDAKMLRLLLKNASPKLRQQATERQDAALAEAQAQLPYRSE